MLGDSSDAPLAYLPSFLHHLSSFLRVAPLMIFVATGTTGFDALAQAMDGLAEALGEPVLVQIGDGAYQPQRAEFFRFAPSLLPYYERASLVVAHGGLGVCVEVLEAGKPLVAVGNPDRYDQHQSDLLRVLEAEGHLVWCRAVSELALAITRARQGGLRPYRRPECTIPTHIHALLCGRPAGARRAPRGLAKQAD
jgi:beta-1,4-N-acetylglucosaminyltransferase